MEKKALLVGINAYPGAPLRGCLNDVDQLHTLLTEQYSFTDENIRVLRDADATAANIEAGLTWLAEAGPESDAGDVRVFHFSGHGTYKADENGDEPDGRDECLVPYDYQTAGYITDDRLGQLYDNFPRASNLTLIMDCCHSGSIQRVPDPRGEDEIVFRFLPVSEEEWAAIDAAREQYEQDREAFVRDEVRRFVREAEGDVSDEEFDRRFRSAWRTFGRRRSRFGDVVNRENNILLAAARDVQTAADARIQGDYHGAFTWHLVDAIGRVGATASITDLMSTLSEAMAQARYTQTPQFECRRVHKNRALFASFTD